MLALILLLFGFYFTMVFGGCRISQKDAETIESEFKFAVNILKFGIPIVLGFTYFVFSLVGYSTAVWHMNQRMVNNTKEGNLPDEQQKLVDAYYDFKKLVNSIGANKKSSKNEFEENEKVILSKLSRKESEKQLSNHLEPLLKNAAESSKEQQQQNLDEFNLLPEESLMNTNREARQNPNASVLPSPSAISKPEESLDTIRQALERDRLEAAAAGAAGASEKQKEGVPVAGKSRVSGRIGDKKSDIA